MPLAFAPSPPSLTVRLDNLTFIVDRQTRRLVQLDKRLRRMRHTSTAPVSGGHHEEQRPLRHTASGPEKTELERERVRLREKENELEKEREKQKEKEKELENERERQREADLERQRQREADVEAERQRQRREELMVLRCEREMELTRELTRKQREINANVQRKMQLLEKMMQENAQQRDVSYNHLTSPPQLLVNGKTVSDSSQNKKMYKNNITIDISMYRYIHTCIHYVPEYVIHYVPAYVHKYLL